ncbi:penicillin amidase [Chitinophaga costaii]|uniref:Penicillin amidase n=1 Tax=Chitinophaga costaii TaxID=1335309 RepID=A0A1C3YVR5_9BACT|nr:penicillin acylase family protein [Chitinophaga costaii]PUZ30120.1 penicillin acylase family protein [Chitinophaga costaii]SCB74122.1 penicillin amidase [Chitinophaga costaii]
MRILPFFSSAIVTLVLIFVLGHKWGSVPPFGKLLSPQQGFWQNATPISKNYNEDLRLPALTGKVNVWLDERMVPHIFATNLPDAYYVEGYLHARDRLWQMELQTRAAAGRLSEILGRVTLHFDRMQRRKGMVYGAENSLRVMEQDTITKQAVDAYTAGVNAYIHQLDAAHLPVEYKLLDYQPEDWTPLKCALLLKYMADDLAGYDNDMDFTNACHLFGVADASKMYPSRNDSLDPIIPIGTAYPAPSVKAIAPPDSVISGVQQLLHFKQDKPDLDNGSNNWAVSGRKTRSGAPILCSDPHLGLHLPSLWYEVQIKVNDMNVYGASLPGAPGVVIGFNDHIAWGVTNAEEDVKDYYLVQLNDHGRQYLFNGSFQPTTPRIEDIVIRGAATLHDTVAYTHWGPVIYDTAFPQKNGDKRAIAMRWKAHDPSDELMTFLKLNHAKNYEAYVDALKTYACPAQNFAFASKDGDIAIWHNGQYPLRWKGQGQYLLPGTDTTFDWQGFIPQEENPHIKNPERGFIASANQNPTDTTYPYPVIGSYDVFRGKRINEQLAAMDQITSDDMKALQTDYTNLFARAAIPLLERHFKPALLTKTQVQYYDLVAHWNLVADAQSKAATVFNLWWANLEAGLWDDDLDRGDNLVLERPASVTTLQWLLRDSSMHFIDDVHTPQQEDLSQLVQQAFVKAVSTADSLDRTGHLALGLARGTDIQHLARLPAFSRMHLRTGGGPHIVNATKQGHGPSWRMVVELTAQTEAYGIYPGGQSGNPGSPYYDNMVSDWVQGRYYPLHVFDGAHSDDPNIRYHLTFAPGR